MTTAIGGRAAGSGDDVEKIGNDKASKPDPRGTAPALVRAPSPSLPKGGGAIRGIGEKFSMNAVTGTGSLSVPIATTPGRAGFSPELSLTYDSGAGNGPFGLGWHLSVPNVSRKTDKRLPEYLDAEESDVFLLSGAEDLVPALDEQGERIAFDRDGFRIERYRPRIEGLFARIERRTQVATGEVHWVGITADNVKSVYGRDPGARVADPERPARVFTWLLERTEDGRGNVIVYEYEREDLANVPGSPAETHRLTGKAPITNTYLKRVRYANTTPGDASTCALEVVFDYGEHDPARPTPERAVGASWPARQDPFSSYRAGFEVRTYRLCRRVLMFHRFPELGEAPCLVRTTNFAYNESPALTKLVSIQQAGYIRDPGTGEYASKAFPALDFKYTTANLQTAVKALDAASLENLPEGVDGQGYRWIDLDGEGIAGVLTHQADALYYKRNLGNGVLGPARRLLTQPSTTALSGGGQQLMDLGGDGQLDLVAFGPPLPGYQARITPGDPDLTPGSREDGGWQPFHPFLSCPDIDWSDPELRFIDLNGDGLDDVLIAKDDVFVWYPSQGKKGFGPPRTFPRPRDEEKGPALVFSDPVQSIFLADISGDGLSDLVRIRNGSICYWPNLGHGRFGPKVTMAGAPWLDRPELFDPQRIRLADVDGSGTTDLLYIGADGVRLWLNQAGNSWLPVQKVLARPPADALSTLTTADLLGNGTACLVWSTPPRGGDRARVSYVDLLGSKKAHLLESIKNNLGLETRLAYAPSTKFHLADRAAGRPWITRLAFPVQVVERVETYDAVSRVRFVSEYRYRHGYFDGDEREFRGFGYVEQIDTESDPALSGKGLFADRPPPVNGERPQPPVITRTWFHTGAWRLGPTISQAFRGEYFAGDLHPSAEPLPDTIVPQGLPPEEAKHACRALKGQILRQEIYARDGTALESQPYSVSERSYEVRRIQPSVGGRPGVFFVHPRETVDYHYERNPADPRIQHAFTLEVDEYGHVRRSAAVGYPRRSAPGTHPEQQKLAATYTETVVANEGTEQDWYRHGAPLETRTYELTGLVQDPGGKLLAFDHVKAAVLAAAPIACDQAPASGNLEKRLIERARTRYFDAQNLPAPLGWGRIDALALPFESYGLAFTPSLLASLYVGRMTDAVLQEGGYVHLDDPADPEGAASWWIPSGRSFPGRRIAGGDGAPPSFEVAPFYLPIEYEDPFGNITIVEYDVHVLLPVEIHDALDNVVRLQNDYRTMSPALVLDPNGNRTSVDVDALGMVVATRVMGKDGSLDGDPAGEPSTKLEYAFYSEATGQPSFVHVAARETHGDPATRWQHSYSYSDGFGREVMKKVQAEPGPAPTRGPDGALVHDALGKLVLGDANPRWIGTGRTVFDNKGNPIKQYEPFFSSTHAYETDDELVQWGVTPILSYDPLGRLIRTEMPNGTVSRVTFTPWEQENWDANDTVLDPGNVWYAARLPTATPLLSAAERRAAVLAAKHAGTLAVTMFDTLGRPFLSIADNGTEGKYETRTTLDIEGNPLVVTDARGNDVMTHRFSLLGQKCYQKSPDSGERWMIVNAAGNSLRTWDSRGHTIRTQYDALQRPIGLWVKDKTGTEILAERAVYGEEHGDALTLNLRGKVHQQYDGAGLVTMGAYDFKGNLLKATRQLAVEYKVTLDWADPAPALHSETFTQTTAFDALNRPISMVTPDQSETRPRYSEANLLDKVDVRIRRAAEWTPIVGNIDYNEKGQRLRIVYGKGLETGTEYAAVTEYEYDPLTFRMTRLLTTRRTSSKVLQDLRYTYDPSGNITEIQDCAHQKVFFANDVVEAHATYEYDAIHRLRKATGREHAGQTGEVLLDHQGVPLISLPHVNDAQALRRYTERYDYDSVGNILKMVHEVQFGTGGFTRHYEIDAGSNRLLSTSVPGDLPGGFYSAKYTYDEHGSMTSMPHLQAIGWNFKDQMREVDLGGGGMAYYVYDATGQRVRKIWEHSGLADERIYLGAYEVYRRHEGVGEVVSLERQTVHVMDGARRVALIETKAVDAENSSLIPMSRVRFQLGNQLGSTTLELDDAGMVLSYEEYRPFGTTAYHSTAAHVGEKHYRYTAKERDDENGLYYCGARCYVTWLGRWCSADPSGISSGANFYSYVSNRPTVLTDPTGLHEEPDEQQCLPLEYTEDPSLRSVTESDFWQSRTSQLEDIEWQQSAEEEHASDVPLDALKAASVGADFWRSLGGHGGYFVPPYFSSTDGSTFEQRLSKVMGWYEYSYVVYNPQSQCLGVTKESLTILGYDTPGSDKQTFGTKRIGERDLSATEQQRLREHLDAILERGNVAVVGLDYQAGHPGNIDNKTDHFLYVVYRTLDDAGELVYIGLDNAASIEGRKPTAALFVIDPKTGSIHSPPLQNGFEEWYHVVNVREGVKNRWEMPRFRGD